jgi:hypothetical protein
MPDRSTKGFEKHKAAIYSMVTTEFIEPGIRVSPKSATKVREAIFRKFDIDCHVHFEGSELSIEPFNATTTARESINKAYFISAAGDDTVYAIEKDVPDAEWKPLERDDERIQERIDMLDPDDRVLGLTREEEE